MSTSLWNKLQVPNSPQLTHHLACEICVVGAGIAGLTTAYRLVKAGHRVVVLHAGDLSASETSKSTAQINTVHDDGWVPMENMHGETNMRRCYQSYLQAFNFIENTIKVEDILCGYEKVPAYLFATNPAEAHPWVEEEYASAKRIGVKDISIVESTPLSEFFSGPTLRYESQAQFQPVAYLQGLQKFLLESGLCSIYGDSRVQDVTENDPSSVSLKLENGSIVTAEKVVLATNIPMHRRLIPIEALAPYRSYVVAFNVPKNSVPNAQFWDNGDPYHYARLEGASSVIDGSEGEYDTLLVGGEDHRVGEMRDIETHYNAIIDWAQKRFPIASVTSMRWSAQSIETFDGMPLIGPCSSKGENIFIITGDSGTGITHGTVGGILVSEALMGREVIWKDLYDPARNRVKSLSRWASENMTSLASYQDWLTPGEVSSEAEIQANDGAIVRRGTTKEAVYRDENGEVTRLSATCPHMGAIVRWNGVEKSWDCPAHGSRFSTTGEVLNGPANCGLCPIATLAKQKNEEIATTVESTAPVEEAAVFLNELPIKNSSNA